MKPRKEMVDLGHPLGHAVVVLVFRLERDLEKHPNKNSGKATWASQAAVAPDLNESGVPVGDQPQAIIIVGPNCTLHE